MNVQGTIWNMDDDCIYTPVKESNEPENYIFIKTSSIFNPLGFLGFF